jgi:hypothetical protein
MLSRLHPPNDIARASVKGCDEDGWAIASIGTTCSDDWSEGSVGSMNYHCASEGSSMVSSDLLVEDIMFDDEDLEEIQGVEIVPSAQFHTSFYGAYEISAETSLDDCSITEAIFEDNFTPIDLYATRNRPSNKPSSPPLNPFCLLPDELLCEIFTYLDVISLSAVRLVSGRLMKQGSKDQSGWLRHCSSLWAGKVSISKRAEEEPNAMDAYRISFKDGNRQEITQQELCFDPKTGAGTVWYFRVKESAGSAWTSFDPWHAGLECRRMVFLSDGTIKELVSDPYSSSSHSFKVTHPFMDVPNRDQVGFGDAEGDAPISMKWRFLSSPMDMPSRPLGAYLRLNVGGRDVPTYIAQRSPTGNWGVVLENCWGVFASFPLPLKVDTGRALPLRPTRMRLTRIHGGGIRWLNMDGMEDESDEHEDMEVDTDRSAGNEHLLRDSALPTTSRLQWREALLYNYGSVTLPEGEAARAEFDRIFSSFHFPIQSLDNMLR